MQIHAQMGYSFFSICMGSPRRACERHETIGECTEERDKAGKRGVWSFEPSIIPSVERPCEQLK